MSIETLNALTVLMKNWEDQIRETRQGLEELSRLATMREAVKGP